MRAIVIVLDSVGVGEAPDAAAYGDAGADTLGHILERFPGLEIRTLRSLGLDRVLGHASAEPCACFGRMEPRAKGKDSTTGHWELAGVVLDEPFATFARFAEPLVEALEGATGERFLGNVAASGTQIIADLGAEHVRTGRPILYTSADSVLQIAAHEEVIAVERLYEICTCARAIADEWRIGRVIARPFVGEDGAFVRTARRHDFSMAPPRTVLDAIVEAGLPVVGIGKVGDLFAGRGFTESNPTGSNEEGMEVIDEAWSRTGRGLVVANLVDFDTEYGHRRDCAGYARALEVFDTWLAGFIDRVRDEDLLIVTADHGNDPTFRGTDHTRECVPLLVRDGGRTDDLGVREGFADVAATLASRFGIEAWAVGRSCV